MIQIILLHVRRTRWNSKHCMDTHIRTKVRGGVVDKEWKKITVDFSNNEASFFEFTDFEDVTEISVFSSLVKNATTTQSGFNFKINDKDIMQNFIWINQSANDVYSYSRAVYDGMLWHCEKGQISRTEKNVSPSTITTSPYCRIRDVGKCRKISLIVPNPLYVPISGIIEIYYR